ncbi:relaxase/mobilization nuclease domain-containing protein [Varibaculum cambriense]|uniref:relaxase/mobilization nuclease domain-containing protein n=1 Tax=Varibaculum cambriense TaxID=184870 RepID=UPI00255729C9|nr:relaxase/mobilization nuclease domain-containing protein [Varibaculum cambriense]MDK8275401.1 relaxase/mobilization nuclease domain-containing protein [Varibaculum cambriense]
MATTKLKHVQSIKKVIEYVCKSQKTTFVGNVEQISKTINSTNYFCGDYTTPQLVEDLLEENQDFRSWRLITGINCFGTNEEKLVKEFYKVKDDFNIDPNEKRPAYHGVQSFKGYEVDPIVCHDIGYEFAKRMWGDKYQVVVATHVNTENVHNHFVVNPTSFIDGKKYRNSKDDIRRMRILNDLVCLEYGLSVVPQENVYSKDKTLPYVDAKKKEFRHTAKVTIRDLIKFDIDRAIANSKNETDFYYFMKDLGYEFKEGMHNKLKPPYSENFFRFDKLDKSSKLYLAETISMRIDVNNYEREHISVPNRYFKLKKKHKKKLKGIQREYIRLMYRLGIFGQRKKGEPLSKVNLKALQDLRNMRIENTYLINNGISTVEELEVLNHEQKDRIQELNRLRDKYYKRRSSGLLGDPIPPDKLKEINSEINRLNKELKELRDKNIIVSRRLTRYEKPEVQYKAKVSENNKEVNQNQDKQKEYFEKD